MVGYLKEPISRFNGKNKWFAWKHLIKINIFMADVKGFSFNRPYAQAASKDNSNKVSHKEVCNCGEKSYFQTQHSHFPWLNTNFIVSYLSDDKHIDRMSEIYFKCLNTSRKFIHFTIWFKQAAMCYFPNNVTQTHVYTSLNKKCGISEQKCFQLKTMENHLK